MTSLKNGIYLDYFNLNFDPFGNNPDPETYFPSHSHSETLAILQYAVEQHEIGLIIGEVGSGKTLLSRCLVDSLDLEHYRICWIINPQLSASGMLKEIYQQLFQTKPPYFKNDVRKALQEGFVELYTQDISPVIIIDEAQAVPTKQVFEEIRLLSNFQTDKENLCSIIFLGQTELEKRIKQHHYRALLERIRFTVRLKPLTEEETVSYVRHKLQVAGASTEIFSEESLKTLHAYCNGLPRRINHLCSFSLMEAMSEQLVVISPDIVHAATKNILYLH